MSAEEYRRLVATGEWPERMRTEEHQGAVAQEALAEFHGNLELAAEEMAREELGHGAEDLAAAVLGESPASGQAALDEMNADLKRKAEERENNPPRMPEESRGPKVTADLYQGRRLFRVAVPERPVSVNHLYRDAIVPGKGIPQSNRTIRVDELAAGTMLMKGKDGTIRRCFTKRVKTKKAKALEKAIRLRLLAAGVHAGSAPAPNTRLWARLWFHGSWTTQKGDIRIQDAVSGEKLILDTVADYLGLQRPLRKKGGDEAFFRVDIQKVEDRAEGFTLEVWTLVR